MTKQTYYGFKNVDGVLKVQKFHSKRSMTLKSSMQRKETLSELFSCFFKHFRTYDSDMSSKIIERHAIALDMGFYEFIRKVECLYNEILENSPEKLI